MKNKRRSSRRRAVTTTHRPEMDTRDGGDGPVDQSKDSSERIPILIPGSCQKGICGQEAACKPFENNTYTCLCPHDSAPPTKDRKCPRRIIVPLNPSRIENIRPPVDNVTTINNKITTNKTSTSPGRAASSITSESLPNQNLIIFGSVACLVLMLLVLIILMKRKYCNRKNKNSSTPSPIALKRNFLVADRYAPNPQYSTCPSTAVPILKRETLKFISEIGEGCFGKVFKGELQSESVDHLEVVAIKVLKETATREAEEDFLREVDIMSAFRHSNILSLLGVVLRDAGVSPMMVFEYMPHGDLAEVLRAQKKRHLNEENVPALSSKGLLSVALQIASGMRYLAAQRFVHRDLACRNCLVSTGPTVKIADFGMSRDVYTCDYYKIGGSRLLPVRWMSPESVIYGRFTLESDIWSYGVVLWEIYSFGKQPYYGHTNEEVVKLILEGIMLIPPEDTPSLICELMQFCWKTEPRDRIRFSDIHAKLEKAHDNFVEVDEMTLTRDNFKFENEKLNSSLKRLPRPPPLPLPPQMDLLDEQGYLLAKEVKEPVQYLETLPD